MARTNSTRIKKKKTAANTSSTRQTSLTYTEPQTAMNALQLPLLPGMALRIMRQLESFIRQVQ